MGTIQPFALEESYGYFDSDLYMSTQLEFDGKGVLNINNGPGLASFSLELNAEVSLIGSGQIDGKFTVNFESGSSRTMTTTAPPGLGTFGGDVHDKLKNAADGYFAVDATTFSTIFTMNLNLETSMNLKMFGYETPLQELRMLFA